MQQIAPDVYLLDGFPKHAINIYLIAFWRESDKLLILGDALIHTNEFGRVRLSEPRPGYTVDPGLNRESARKLAKLNPEIIYFGHGPVLRNGRQFQSFITQQPTL